MPDCVFHYPMVCMANWPCLSLVTSILVNSNNVLCVCVCYLQSLHNSGMQPPRLPRAIIPCWHLSASFESSSHPPHGVHTKCMCHRVIPVTHTSRTAMQTNEWTSRCCSNTDRATQRPADHFHPHHNAESCSLLLRSQPLCSKAWGWKTVSLLLPHIAPRGYSSPHLLSLA